MIGVVLLLLLKLFIIVFVTMNVERDIDNNILDIASISQQQLKPNVEQLHIC